jgi:hypothetical protein
MMNSVKTNLFIILFLNVYYLASASELTYSYISTYREIVISEMHRTGIPASIKMAQAIVESASGTSTLARQSNNHFGIKCGNSWEGETVYRHDDDYENGLLVRSCFRAYDDPVESFYAHSDFLANPYSQRYKPLFELDVYDYKAWAYGLKKAGYATDKNYPKKLIDIIEKYELFKLDFGYIPPEEELLAVEETSLEKKQPVEKPEKKIIARPTGANSSKSNYSSSKEVLYTVRIGDRMEDIASHHNMDLRELYFKNRMPFGSQPQVGETIVLNEYLHFKRRPKIVKSVVEKSSADEYLFEESIEIASD